MLNESIETDKMELDRTRPAEVQFSFALQIFWFLFVYFSNTRAKEILFINIRKCAMFEQTAKCGVSVVKR